MVGTFHISFHGDDDANLLGYIYTKNSSRKRFDSAI
jgi:hypothetical protein